MLLNLKPSSLCRGIESFLTVHFDDKQTFIYVLYNKLNSTRILIGS